MERIKKASETVRLGEPTKVPEFPNINTFIMKEIEIMSALGLEIKNTLTVSFYCIIHISEKYCDKGSN